MVRSNRGPQGANRSRRTRTIQILANPRTPWVGLAILTLITGLLVETRWAPRSAGVTSAGSASGLLAQGPPRMTWGRYLREGQWKADVRTALEELQYILSPDLDNPSPPVLPQPAPVLSAATNSGTNMPKA